MSDIFICYAREDIDAAMLLVEQLQAEGWKVFIDKKDHIGRRWHKQIERELRVAGAVVVLWSGTSRNREFVLEEAQYGKQRNILFPALIESVECPPSFDHIHTANLVDWNGDPEHPEWMALMDALRLHFMNEQAAAVAASAETGDEQNAELVPESADEQTVEPEVDPRTEQNVEQSAVFTAESNIELHNDREVAQLSEPAQHNVEPNLAQSSGPVTRRQPTEAARSTKFAPSAHKPDQASEKKDAIESGGASVQKFLIVALLITAVFLVLPLLQEWYQQFTAPQPVSATPSAEQSVTAVTPNSAVMPAETDKPQKASVQSDAPEWLPTLVRIPAGSFDMGEQEAAFIKNLSAERQKFYGLPGKKIDLPNPFYLSKTEITYAQYDYYRQQQQKKGIAVASPETAAGGRGNQPVVHVNWFEALAYARWLGEQRQQNCRLPTEAEWEYAARAGTRTAYPWGSDLGSNHANCDGCGSQWDGKQAAPVGRFTPNALGLRDLSGNVAEWTCTNWSARGAGELSCNDDVTDAQPRVVRGGSWRDKADFVRVSARSALKPDDRGSSVTGFRVLCVATAE